MECESADENDKKIIQSELEMTICMTWCKILPSALFECFNVVFHVTESDLI
jgi:hypothetical protein